MSWLCYQRPVIIVICYRAPHVVWQSVAFHYCRIYYEADRQEWVVDKISAKRNVNFYTCCPEPYPDVTFTIRMRRGSLFYMVHLVGPCFLMFAISLLGFYLPIDSGEKVSFETTILLALVVFLLMVGETMPPTPDSIPIVGRFTEHFIYNTSLQLTLTSRVIEYSCMCQHVVLCIMRSGLCRR